jgi:IS5 family transposase
MHQSKRDNQWYFGMNAHLGVDVRYKLIHSVLATADNAPYCLQPQHGHKSAT